MTSQTPAAFLALSFAAAPLLHCEKRAIEQQTTKIAADRGRPSPAPQPGSALRPAVLA